MTLQVKRLPLRGFVVAETATGRRIELAVSHTLVIGKSGSGKGSVLQSIVRACLPHVLGGFVQLWGIDPKRAEIAGPITRVYQRVASTPEEIVRLLCDLYELMLARQGERSFHATVDRPLVVLQMDEFTSAFDALDRAQTSEVTRDLRMLLLQGRSAGIIVVAYGQEATKESTAMRDSFPQRVCLRVQTTTEVDLVLGAGAVDQGAMAHLIPVASASNGYETAGIAYVRADTGEIERARFPYTSDTDLERLAAEFDEHQAATAESDETRDE